MAPVRVTNTVPPKVRARKATSGCICPRLAMKGMGKVETLGPACPAPRRTAWAAKQRKKPSKKIFKMRFDEGLFDGHMI